MRESYGEDLASRPDLEPYADGGNAVGVASARGTGRPGYRAPKSPVPRADLYLEYNADRRVTKESLDGGTRTYTFGYTTSLNADGYNSWKRRTVETRPDGSEVIVYTNFLGQAMPGELALGGDSWITYDQMDDDARVVLHALPSAVTGYDDTAADLDVALRPADGLIHVYDYYSTTGGGAAAGYLQTKKIKRGSGGDEVLLKLYEYTSNTAGGDTTKGRSAPEHRPTTTTPWPGGGCRAACRWQPTARSDPTASRPTPGPA